MKIGEFAQKYDVNQSTVRYYIEKALLTPERRNGQYIFGKTCMEQMERVLDYKRLGFSLDELGTIVCYEDASNLKDKRVLQRLIDVMKDKEETVRRSIAEQERVLTRLEQEIRKYEELAEEMNCCSKFPGMPLDALSLLRCPRCGTSLELEDAVISSAGIQDAKIDCECGYQAKIRSGILIGEGSTEDSPLKIFENIDSVSAITDDFSMEYSNLMSRGHLWSYQKISQEKDRMHYVMVGPFTYNFILKYIRQLPEDVTYILIDESVDKIRKLQQYFSDLKYRIIYIAAGSDMLPLQESSIDCYVDDFSNINYTLAYSRDLMQLIGPLVRLGGKMVGLLNDYSEAGRSLENIKEEYNDFDPGQLAIRKMYQNMLRAGFEIEEKNNLGSPAGNEKAFRQQAENETISLIAYVAEKGSQAR